jgi:plasmid stabilization system protein ParE
VTPPLPVVFTRRAEGHVREAGTWWRDNRAKAPEALAEELANALRLVASQPDVGAVARNVRLPGVRRVLLRRVNYYLYYQLVESPTRMVQVVAFWHASRGSAPEL